MPKHDDLLRTLRGLSPEDWKTVRDKIDAFHSLKSKGSAVAVRSTTTSVQTGADYLTGIIAELRRRKILQSNLRSGLAFVRKVGPDLLAGVDRGWTDVLTAVGTHLKVAEQAKLAEVAARALADHLEARGKKINAWSMCANAENTLMALDDAFPGYGTAGLLAMVVIGAKNGRR
jgi:hypothetical protein